jgi:hypothetical protein
MINFLGAKVIICPPVPSEFPTVAGRGDQGITFLGAKVIPSPPQMANFFGADLAICPPSHDLQANDDGVSHVRNNIHPVKCPNSFYVGGVRR